MGQYPSVSRAEQTTSYTGGSDLKNARRYVKNATGAEQEYLVLMVAGIMYEYRVAEDELKKALDAITPFFVQEAYCDAETRNQSP